MTQSAGQSENQSVNKSVSESVYGWVSKLVAVDQLIIIWK